VLSIQEPYKNGVIRPNWNLLRKIWYSRDRGSFMKRQKDKEIMDERRASPLNINGVLTEKVMSIDPLVFFF
jgi:hypothetical protein